MLDPIFLIPFQLFILIANTIAISLLEAIIWRDDIVRTWYVSCTVFIAYYYVGWSILLIIVAYTANSPSHHYPIRITLHILNTIYDIGIFAYTVIGFTTIIPDMMRYTAKQQSTALVSANIIYQVGTLTHTIFNARYVCDYFIIPTAQTNYSMNRRRIIYRVYPVTPTPHLNILHVLHVPRKAEDEAKTFCCICMTEETHVTILPCKHREFCLNCIERIRELMCPLCRVPFTTVESERGDCTV